jgi:hypothetical protein
LVLSALNRFILPTSDDEVMMWSNNEIMIVRRKPKFLVKNELVPVLKP